MNLLAEIYSQDQMIPKMFGPQSSKVNQGFDLNEIVCGDDFGVGINSQESPYMLSTLAPRLWPFMRHSIVSVRHSAIRTLVNFSFVPDHFCPCTIVDCFSSFRRDSPHVFSENWSVCMQLFKFLLVQRKFLSLFYVQV